MFNRVFAAACATALGAGVLSVPVESAARSGMAGGAHPAFVRPHSFVPRHIAAPPRPAVQSHVPVPPRAAVAPNTGVRPFFSARADFRRHHRGFWHRDRFWSGGFPYAAGTSGPYYGSNYDPSDYSYYDPANAYYDPSDVVGSLWRGVVNPSVYSAPGPGIYPVSAAPAAQPVSYGCQTQTVTVSVSSGDKNDVTIVRC
jgi:hypothetical protein